MSEPSCQPPGSAALCCGCRQPLEPEEQEGLCAQCLLGRGLRLSDEAVDLSEAEDEVISAAALEGRTLGGYEIQKRIAQGGMGVVYRAKQLRPERVAALKVISTGDQAGPRLLERFQNEVRAVARLDHPNIVPIYEVGQDRGWHFFSMRFIEGGTLADLIRRGPAHPENAARLILKVARAVDHAHHRGILHRDIKPTNILLDESGEPQLTDFGLAKLSELETGLTLSRAAMGTPAYMSPEQASGNAREITTETDVYGLGAVLYELLSGKLPFHAENAPALLRKIVEEEPAPLPQEVPRDLRVICLKCLEKTPARRYRSAGELADELERWLRHEPIQARPASAAERARKWVRRHPTASVAAGATALALLALVVLGASFTYRLNRARQVAEQHASTARQRLIESRMSDAARLSAEGDGFKALLSLTAALRETKPGEAVEASIQNRLRATLQTSPRLMRVWKVEGWATELRFGQNDTLLAATLNNGAARVWDLPKNAEIPMPGEERAQAARSVISPDGGQIAQTLADAPFVRLWNPGAASVLALKGFKSSPSAIAFSPDGSLLAAAERETVEFWDAHTGEKRAGRLANHEEIRWLGYRPDGQGLLTVGLSEQAKLWDLAAGTTSVLPVRIMTRWISPSFSPDGRWLLAAQRTQVMKLEAGTWETTFRLDMPGAYDARFSPDGRLFATAGFYKQASLWDTETGEAQPYRFEHESGANRVRFSPDGRWAATAGFDQMVRLRWLDGRQFGSRVLHQGAVAQSIAFSENGRFLAVANTLGLVRVWDLAPAQPSYLAAGGAPVQWSLTSGRLQPLVKEDQARFWDVSEGRQTGPSIRLPGPPKDFVSGNRLFAAVFGEGGAGFWDIASGRNVLHVTNAGPAGTIFLSPNEQFAALVGLDDHRMRLIELPSGRLLSPAEGWDTGNPKFPLFIVWSNDGEHVAAGRDLVQIWSLKTGKKLDRAVKAPWGLGGLVFAPDGKRLLIAFRDNFIEPSFAQAYNTLTLEPEGPQFHHADGAGPVRFSPDGKLMATTGEDNAARIWHAADGSPAASALRHGNEVISVSFSADGSLLVTGARDGLVRIWDTARGELIAPPVRVGLRAGSVKFTGDGQKVTALDETSHTHVLRIYEDGPLAGDAERLAICGSGLSATPRGAGDPLRADEVAELFQRLFNAHPEAFAWPGDSIAWHEETAAQSEHRNSWQSAAFHLRHLAKAKPLDEDAQTRLERAQAAR